MNNESDASKPKDSQTVGQYTNEGPAMRKFLKNLLSFSYGDLAVDREVWNELQTDARALLARLEGGEGALP